MHVSWVGSADRVDLRRISTKRRGENKDVTGSCHGRVAAVVLALLGGTTWLSGVLWAPDGVYLRFVSPAIGLVWGMVVSVVLLTRSPATRAGW
jgi:hypothetical protein